MELTRAYQVKYCMATLKFSTMARKNTVVEIQILRKAALRMEMRKAERKGGPAESWSARAKGRRLAHDLQLEQTGHDKQTRALFAQFVADQLGQGFKHRRNLFLGQASLGCQLGVNLTLRRGFARR